MNTVVTSRQALLAASRTVARRQGLGGLSIRAVAAEARVSVGSVYNYFSGKTELLAATVEEIWMQILSAPEGEALRFGRLVIQKGEATATKDGADLELTPREFELLAYLASHAGRVFSRQELMERVWNYEGYVGDVRAVDVAIRRLREKVEDDPAQPKYIITRRGAGYYFQQEP